MAAAGTAIRRIIRIAMVTPATRTPTRRTTTAMDGTVVIGRFTGVLGIAEVIEQRVALRSPTKAAYLIAAS